MNPLPNNWVEEIFRRFHGRFGNRFLAEFSTGRTGKTGQDEGIENAKRVWAEELSGFTPEEIKRGLSAQYDYLPDCDKFKIACRPTIDLEQAFCEAVEQMRMRSENKDKWSSAVIYWAAVELGNDIKNYPCQSIKARWKAAFEKARTKIRHNDIIIFFIRNATSSYLKMKTFAIFILWQIDIHKTPLLLSMRLVILGSN